MDHMEVEAIIRYRQTKARMRELSWPDSQEYKRLATEADTLWDKAYEDNLGTAASIPAWELTDEEDRIADAVFWLLTIT